MKLSVNSVLVDIFDVQQRSSIVAQTIGEEFNYRGSVQKLARGQLGQQFTETRSSLTPLQFVVQYGSGIAPAGAPTPGTEFITAPLHCLTENVASHVKPVGVVIT